MNTPFSAPVLGAATLISSPALYEALVVGSLPLETAVVRFVVAAAVVWVGMSLVSALLSATSPDPVPGPPQEVRALPSGGDSPVEGPVPAHGQAADH